MFLTEVLTIIFVVLKLCNLISWNWFFVLLPEIIALVVYIPIFIVRITLDIKIKKTLNKLHEEKNQISQEEREKFFKDVQEEDK